MGACFQGSGSGFVFVKILQISQKSSDVFWKDPLCKKSKTFFILVSLEYPDTFLFNKIFGWSKFWGVWIWICVCRSSKNRQKSVKKSVKKSVGSYDQDWLNTCQSTSEENYTGNWCFRCLFLRIGKVYLAASLDQFVSVYVVGVELKLVPCPGWLASRGPGPRGSWCTRPRGSSGPGRRRSRPRREGPPRRGRRGNQQPAGPRGGAIWNEPDALSYI